MKIEVLQRHIDDSPSTGSCTDCPIALSLREAGHTNIQVGGLSVDIDGKNYRFSISVSEMGEFLLNPQPRTFELEETQ